MGILSNLFKTKNPGPKVERREARNPFAPREDESPEISDSTQEEPAAKTTPPRAADESFPLRSINFGGSKATPGSRANPASPAQQKKNIHSTVVSDVKKTVKKVLAARATTIPDKQIVIDLEDVLPQIPAEFLVSGGHGSCKKELRFNTYELLPGLSLGKAEVPLARIAELVPEMFASQNPAENPDIKLPLQKVVAQIGAFPGRPDQMEEQFPPLDARFTKLVVEKGVPPPAIAAAPGPVEPAKVEAEIASVVPVAPGPAPAPVEQPVAAVPEPVEPAKVEAEIANIVPAAPGPAPAPVEQPVAAVAEPEIPEAAIEKEEVAPLPPPPVIDEKVSYSLAALLPNAPKSWLTGDLKSVGNRARITVPFHLIESQLATGRVELGFDDFFQALPGELKSHFSGDHEEARTARIQIPLNEVFQNLPGAEPLPPPPEPEIVEPPKEEAPEPVVSDVQPPVLEEPKAVENHAPVVEAPADAVTVAPPEQKAGTPEAPQTSAPVTAEPAPEIQPETDAKKEYTTVSDEESAMLTAMPDFESAEEPETPAAPAEPVATPPVAAEPAQAPASVEPVPPAAPVEPPKTPAEPPAPMYPDPAANPAHLAPSFTLPKIQFQRIAPPTFMAKDSAAPVDTIEKPVEEFESSKILAFTGITTAFNENAVEDLFTTDGKVDSGKVLVYVGRLPGIQAVVLTTENTTHTGGDIPPHFNLEATGNAANVLFQALQGQPGGATQNVTLHHEGFSTTWFKQGTILLGVLHGERALAEGQHDQLALVAEEVARLRTT